MNQRPGRVTIWAAVILVAASTSAFPQARIPTAGGLNIYSKDQDVQLGKEASAEVEKQLRLVDNPELNQYIQGIGERLVKAPEAGQFPYTFHVVWDDSINAFALPGGPLYINTGLILAAENEAQLAGVMGHEISHVALRHGTRQATKAQGIGLLAILAGAAVGGDGSLLGSLAQAGIGLGANSVLLKYSRNAESDADLLGARIMAEAGYNPIEASRFFEKLEAETGSRSGLEAFFSDHPNPGNRSARIEAQLPYMPPGPYNGDTGQLQHMQQLIRGMTPPPEVSDNAPAAAPAPATGQPPPLEQPSNGYRQHQGDGFTLRYPENWQVYPGQDQRSVTFAPQGGLVQAQNGGAIGRGVMVGFADLGRSANLQQDTQTLVDEIIRGNPGMKAANRRPRQLRVGGSNARLTTFTSTSPYGNLPEVDLLLTVARPNGLYYMVFISPQSELRTHQGAFDTMMRSVQFP